MSNNLNNILKLKLINNSIKDFKDNDLSTNLFDIFIKLYKQAYPDIFTKNFEEYKQKFQMIKSLNEYIFITQITSSFNMASVNNATTKQRKIVKDVLKNNRYLLFKEYFQKNILIDKFSDFNTLNIYELIHKNNLFNFEKKNIHLCNLTNKSDLNETEWSYFYNQNNKCDYKIDNDIFIFKKYNMNNLKNEKIIKNKDKIKDKNINIIEIDDYIDLNFVNFGKVKYDIINSTLRCFFYELNRFMNDEFIGYIDVQINYFILLFALKNLNIGGHLILYIGQVICKPVADFILIGKRYFEETIIDYTKLTINAKYTGVYVVFKNFKGVNKSDFNKLSNLGSELLKNDKSSCLGFTITDKKLINETHWKREPSRKKIIGEFLNLKSIDNQYDFIREFNTDFYSRKIIGFKRILKYYDLYHNKEIPYFVKEEQLIHSYAYAKEFNLKTVPFGKDLLNDFKTMIAEDIYKLYNGKMYELINLNNYDEIANIKIPIKDNIDNLAEEYNIILNIYNKEISTSIDKTSWLNYYKLDNIVDELKRKIDNETNINISDKDYVEWFKYYEIFMKFNVIGDKITLKGLHICDNDLISVNAVRYFMYIHKKNLISYNWNLFNLNNTKSDNTIYELNEDDIDNKYKNSMELIVSNCSENFIKIFNIVFRLLKKNGNLILKYKYPIEYKNLDLLFLCYKHFNKITFYRPVYSNIEEFFIICENYDPLLEKNMNKIDGMNLSEHFKVNINNAITNITNDVIYQMSKIIFYTRNNEDLPNQNIEFIKKIIKNRNDEWFKIFMPQELTHNKKNKYMDISYFGEIFTNDKVIVKKFTNKYNINYNNQYNNNNQNNNKKFAPSLKMFTKLVKKYDAIGTLMDDKIRYPDTLYNKVAYMFELFTDKKFKEHVSNTYGYNVSQAGIKMNEMIVSIKDLIPKDKQLIKTFHICEAPGSFIKMIKYYVTNILKKEMEWNAQSLNPHHSDNIKKYGKGILEPMKNADYHRWKYGVDNTGDITNIENIISYGEYCKDVDLITSDCGLGENIRDIHSEKILFYSTLFMLINVPIGKNCLLKFYLPFQSDLSIYMMYLLYKYFDKTYMFKPIVNFRSGEFYMICIGKKFVPKELIVKLSKKNISYDIVSDISFLLQLYDFSNEIISKREIQLERLIYLMNNYDLISNKEFNLMNNIKNKRFTEWYKTYLFNK